MNVLILGNPGAFGARETALARMCVQSDDVERVYAFDRNAGFGRLGDKMQLRTRPGSVNCLASWCHKENISTVLIGPEQPLADGHADVLRTGGIAVFGPGAQGAMLEVSKAEAVRFMQRNNVPTAPTQIFTDLDSAMGALLTHPLPIVVKPDGLTGGKGVGVCPNVTEAAEVLQKLYADDTSATVLLQEFLPDNPDVMERAEISVQVIITQVGGKFDYVTLDPIQDYKPRFDGDTGPMTGGMGCFGPVPNIDMNRIDREIIQPTIWGMHKEHIPYRGVLYFGLKMCPEGPRVVEYNVRFGDPEKVIISELFGSQLVPIMLRAARGEMISHLPLTLLHEAAVGVVIVGNNYPDKSPRGSFPSSLDTPNTYHAGTEREGKLIMGLGGREAVVTATGETIAEAQAEVYEQIEAANLSAYYAACRSDIAANW